MKKELIITNNAGNTEVWTRVDRDRGNGFSSWTNGWSIETLNDCIYARYGYHSYEQLEEYEG